jgi:hypothetical protein
MHPPSAMADKSITPVIAKCGRLINDFIANLLWLYLAGKIKKEE